MIAIEQHKNIQTLNTLGAASVAQAFIGIEDDQQLREALDYAEQEGLSIRVLGGGSNLILSEQLPYLIIQLKTQGRRVVSQSASHQVLAVKAGEDWHEFVQFTLTQGLSGLENLALIPGNVGACPVQNIGAYGVEVGQFIKSVDAFDLIELKPVSFSQEQCQFGYRDSIFKQNENRYLILDVYFELPKTFKPVLGYGPLKALAENATPTAMDVFEKVIEIRQQKLPDPVEIPNAGSFFKNPVVTAELALKLKQQFPEMVSYDVDNGVKLAAGWLIDHAGLKGKSGASGVGCFEKQALVVVNPNRAAATDILAWAKHVAEQVAEKFSVQLEIEPRIW